MNRETDFLYELTCRLERIENILNSLSTLEYPIRSVKNFTVGTSLTQLYIPSGETKSLVEIVNATYLNPDVLRITIMPMGGSIPINSDSSRKFFIREGQQIYGRFDNISAGEVVVIEYDL